MWDQNEHQRVIPARKNSRIRANELMQAVISLHDQALGQEPLKQTGAAEKIANFDEQTDENGDCLSSPIPYDPPSPDASWVSSPLNPKGLCHEKSFARLSKIGSTVRRYGRAE